MQHPVTQHFLRLLKESRQETLENWSRELYVGNSAEQSALCNAKALGGVAVLDQVIQVIEDMKEEEEDAAL